MAAQKSIGITIFTICCALYGRSAFIAPTEDELKDPNVARKSQNYGSEKDPEGLLHGLRYYILGIGVIGLGIALEDHFLERSAKKKPNQPAPTPAVAGQPPRQP